MRLGFFLNFKPATQGVAMEGKIPPFVVDGKEYEFDSINFVYKKAKQ
jgi:hypothetical protein